VQRYTDGQAGIVATFARAYLSGPSAYLELTRPGHDQPIEVEIPVAEFQRMDLKAGESLVVQPRNAQVFLT
jgi:sulfate transport system ATP-binding protein